MSNCLLFWWFTVYVINQAKMANILPASDMWGSSAFLSSLWND